MLCRLEVLALIVAAFTLPAIGAAQAEQPAPASSVVQANLAPHPAPEQPLPYSHKTHVSMGLACQLCHVNPEPGREMTFPDTAACMSCHANATLVTDRPAIRKLAEYAHSKQPIPWVRVYKLLPGVTWSHRKHLEAGVPCETCHGAVGNLEAMSEITAITGMATCISCHQHASVSAACNVCHAWPAK